MSAEHELAPIAGIHHVTAIAGDAQANLDFYVGVLGMRFIKRTVNFDDPGSYHFYFADWVGTPGAVLTFFPWMHAKRGVRGRGEAGATAMAVLPESIGWWRDRLGKLGVDVIAQEQRFGDDVLVFEDHDGTRLELVGSESHRALPEDLGDVGSGGGRGGGGGGDIDRAHALRGFHSVTLVVADAGPTAELLRDVMGFAEGPADGARRRFVARSPDSTLGRVVDVVESPGLSRSRFGAGSVHHVAFRAPDSAELAAWRTRLEEHEQNATEIVERCYFRSIYMREPGGVIFEFATDGPGFSVDESVEGLGGSLRLPPWLEDRRAEIEERLPSVRVPEVRVVG